MLSVGLLRFGQLSSVASKIVYRWVTVNDIIDFEIATSVAALPVEFVLRKTLTRLLLLDKEVVPLDVMKEYGDMEYISSHS